MTRELKLKWIDALKQTIDQYSIEIFNNTPHESQDCSLCMLDEELGSANCGCCIHMNEEFGQGKHCYDQNSYFPIFDDISEESINHPTAMPYRRSYLIKIRNKLIASLSFKN